MNSICIGSAIVHYMSTPVDDHTAETFLAVFIALADAEKDVSSMFMKTKQLKNIPFFSFMALQRPWNSSQIIIHRLLLANH